MLGAIAVPGAPDQGPSMLIAILVLVALGLIIGVFVLGTVFSLAWQLVVGLVIGGVARWALPGTHQLGWLATALCGVVGSLVGGLLAHHVFGVTGARETVLNVLCAMGVIWLLHRT